MRIVGGTNRGHSLLPPPPGTRPTSDRVREGIFSALEARFDLADAVVLDVFAGTGALGLEALSRGASRAYFVERNTKALAVIRANAKKINQLERCFLVSADARSSSWMTRDVRVPAHVVFFDPPYEDITLVGPLLRDLSTANRVVPGGFVIIEHSEKQPPTDLAPFEVEQSYRYGDTSVILLRAPNPLPA